MCYKWRSLANLDHARQNSRGHFANECGLMLLGQMRIALRHLRCAVAQHCANFAQRCALRCQFARGAVTKVVKTEVFELCGVAHFLPSVPHVERLFAFGVGEDELGIDVPHARPNL
jgi:hypothetical protein